MDRFIRRQVRRSWARCNDPCWAQRVAPASGEVDPSALDPGHTRYARLVLQDRASCPCRSGEAYKDCCKGRVRVRRRLLLTFIDSRCARVSEAGLGPPISTSGFVRRLQDWLARRRQTLPVKVWLAEDLEVLGLPLHEGAVSGLRWRAPSTVRVPRSRRAAPAAPATPATPARPPAEARTVASPPSSQLRPLRVVRASDPLTEQGFLERMAVAPDDAALRQVFGDWLFERGDVRGELIALQYAAQRRRGDPELQRASQRLIAAHERAWLGPLAPLLRETRYDRGLLESAVLAGRRAELAAVVGDPRWSTLQRLRVVHTSGAAEVLAGLIGHPVMRALRSVRGVWRELGEALFRERPAGLEELFFDGTWRDRLPRRGEFPGLRHLGLPAWTAPATLGSCDLLSWLPRLSVYTRDLHALGSLAQWHQLLERRGDTSVRRLRLFGRDPAYEPRGVQLTFTRGQDDRLSALRVRWIGRTKGPMVAHLAQGLAALDPEALTALSIDPCRRHKIYRLHRQQLEQAVARQRRLTRCDLPHGADRGGLFTSDGVAGPRTQVRPEPSLSC